MRCITLLVASLLVAACGRDSGRQTDQTAGSGDTTATAGAEALASFKAWVAANYTQKPRTARINGKTYTTTCKIVELDVRATGKVGQPYEGILRVGEDEPVAFQRQGKDWLCVDAPSARRDPSPCDVVTLACALNSPMFSLGDL